MAFNWWQISDRYFSPGENELITRRWVNILLLPSMVAFLLYLIFCIITYTVIFKSKTRSARRSSASMPDHRNLRIQAGHVIPSLIIGTYLVLVVAPLVAGAVCFLSSAHKIAWIMIGVYGFGFKLNSLVDALIYVFMDRRIRGVVKEGMGKWYRVSVQRSVEKLRLRLSGDGDIRMQNGG